MLRRYFGDLVSLLARPAEFFERVFQGSLPSGPHAGLDAGSRRFVRLTGMMIAAVFFLQEILSGGRFSWVVVVVAVLSLALFPFITQAIAAMGAGFVRLSCAALGEQPVPGVAERSMAYATAGFLPLAFGITGVSWLSLATAFYLTVGLEKGLRCTRFKAAVLAGFPTVLFLTLLLLSAVIFNIQVL
jgi:hypothetical protein